MKTSTSFKPFVLAFLLSSLYANSQLYVGGSINNWNKDEALLVSQDFMTGEMETWGKVDANGEAQLELAYDFMTLLQEKAEEAKKDAPEGWSLKFKTVADTFGSDSSSFPGEFTFENGDAVVAGVPDLIVGNEEKKEKYGVLYLANSPEMAKWLYNYQMGSGTQGYYIRYYFVEKDATAKGQVSIPTVSHSGEEYDNITEVDLQLEEGWNMIKYEIAEVFTSSDGTVYPSKTVLTRERFLPEGLQWLVLDDN
ncbi:hypothetical protein U1E44_13995 [Arenibacter sp. GZD96]|uniref:hypothetical protein n=1 Tax=Aurantibrevibacter litoralis TaxID=3106030 RepID=UPI002AFF6DB3|nr:hypothetical protein [Arenibacter sp. GZD-96]MEA1787209.1 hypothetical protein [Arenibacter sp. GZD-96]